MKVQNIKRPEQDAVKMRGLDTHDDGIEKSRVFKKTLTNLSKQQHAEHLKSLKAEIDKQGARLADRVDVKELEKYRQLIREFLDEIVSNGYTFTKENAFASRGRHRFLATVKTIDEKLDEIGKEVLKEQSNSIEILAKIDDIRGLLLDMML